jgi:excisionase family DNA binding protein
MTIAGRVTVDEIAKRLAIGRAAVYAMLEKRIIPAIRLGRRWLVTRHSYELWEQRCGCLDQMGGIVQLQ